MAVDVETSPVIARPRHEVAAYACDPDRATAWYANIVAVKWETPPPLAVGSRLAFVARFMGRRLEYTYEVREHVPGERFVMATAQGPFPMETTLRMARRGGRRDADDAAHPRRAVGLCRRRRATDDPRDAAREPQGPRGAEGA